MKEFTEEAMNLRHIYNSTLEKFKNEEDLALAGLVENMEVFIQVYKARERVTNKLIKLDEKLDCDCTNNFDDNPCLYNLEGKL